MSNQYVFNQYYIDFIKILKQASKKIKDEENDKTVKIEGADNKKYELAKKITKAIKSNYVTLDKSSDEYISYVNQFPEEFWKSYEDIEKDKSKEWFEMDNVSNVELYQNITIDEIRKLLSDDFLCYHFITVFYLFKNELNDEQVKKYVSILQESYNEETYEEVENVKHKEILKKLNEFKKDNIKDKSGINMNGMEDTMLGKLAKEILEDVDVDKLQKSIGENGDILKAIGDHDSGFGDLISNVSRKMASKISSGELKQENLLQDAMKFASSMPGLFGNQGGATVGASGTNCTSAPDMANMMNMMSSMMNNKEGMDMFKNMMGGMNKNKKTHGAKTSFNKNAYKKAMAINKLKSKISKKREENQNVSNE